MTAEQYRRVRELFEEALTVPGAALDAWLSERCDDGEVRREVASLLASHSQAGDFLTQPAGDLASLLEEDGPGPTPGQELGPYRIVAEAGRGGMGRVYRAVDTRLDRTVAIKSLPARFAADASYRERLRREARAAAALTHPGICTVHALEEIAGELYLVTEFIEGRTLRDEIDADARPTPALALETARQLAAALASAHGAGVIHRDLKPENVMRTADGRIKILDFGLARVEQATSAPALVTQPGAVMGTPAYMAPEQLNGEPVDARADVFAFGVLIHEYVTGRHPFDAPTAVARVWRVLAATPEPVAQRRPDLPAQLARAIDRCLLKPPASRFASGKELLEAIALPAAVDPVVRPDLSAVSAVAAVPRTESRLWWRMHNLVMIGLYFTAVSTAWLVKEWHHGVTSGVFIALGLAAAVVGVLRAHLVFAEQAHGIGLDRERRRVSPVTLSVDLLIAFAMGLEGLFVSSTREVAGVLMLGLAVGIALARLVMEPATTRAAFETQVAGGRDA